MARKKIALVGAGQIGGTLALLAGVKQLGDIVMSTSPKRAAGQKGSISRKAPRSREFDAKITAATTTASSRAPTSSFVTAGVPRKPGMSATT